MKRFLTLGSVLFGLLFAYAAVVQYNDPDPFQWMVLYGVGALVCGLHLAGRLPLMLSATVAAGCLVWALALGFVLWQSGAFFDDRQMVGIVEPGRELLGLALVGGWSGVLAFAARRRAAG